MPKFSLNPLSIMNGDEEYVKSVIFENNTEFKSWRDPRTINIIIECENKPRSLYASGYIWEEVHE